MKAMYTKTNVSGGIFHQIISLKNLHLILKQAETTEIGKKYIFSGAQESSRVLARI